MQKMEGMKKWKREREKQNTPSVFWLNTSVQCAPTSQLTHVRRFLTNTFLLTEKRGRLYFVRCWWQTLTFNSRQSFRVCLENQCCPFANLMGLQAEGVRGALQSCVKMKPKVGLWIMKCAEIMFLWRRVRQWEYHVSYRDSAGMPYVWVNKGTNYTLIQLNTTKQNKKIKAKKHKTK